MAVNMGKAVAYLDLNTDGFQAGLKRTQGLIKTLQDSGVGLGDKFTAIGKSLTDTGKTLTASFTAPLVGAGVAAVKTASQFESGMSQVQATLGITKDATSELNGATVNTMQALSDLAQQMGAETKFSATEAAAAINNMAMAGYRTQEIFTALPEVMNLAAAGSLDLDYATQLAANGLNVFGMGVENLSEMSDKLAVTASSAYGSVSDFGEGLLVAGGQAKLANLSLTDTFTALGILGDNGISAAEGGTMLRNVLKNLYTPTEKAATVLEELGLETADSNGEIRDFRDVLTDLSNVLGDMTEEERIQAMAEIFDTRTIAGANALLNTSVDRWNDLHDAIDNSSGAAKQMADTQLDNLSGQLVLLKSGLEGVAIGFGNVLLPTIKDGVKWLQDLVTKINNLSTEEKEQITRIAAIVAAVGPLLVLLGSLAKGIGAISTIVGALGPYAGPIAIAIAGFAALAGVIELIKHSSDLATQGAQDLRDSIQKSTDGIEEANKKYENTATTIAATKETALQYVGVLEDLEKEYGKAAGEQEEYKVTVEKLKAIMPELNIVLDEQTGLIAGGTSALRDQIDAWEDLAIQQAKQQLMQDKYNNYINLVKASADATVQRNIAEKEATLLQGQHSAAAAKLEEEYARLTGRTADADTILREYNRNAASWNENLNGVARAYSDVDGKLQVTNQAVADYTTVEKEASDATNVAKEELDEYGNYLDKAFGSLNGTAEAQGELTTAVEETTEAMTESQAIYMAIQGLVESTGHSIDEYNSKLDDLTSQTHNAFEVISQDSSVSYEKMKENLMKNLEIMQNWSTNVQAAFERAGKLGIDEGFLQYLVDLGPQGAMYLEAFMQQSDEEWQDVAKVWSEGGKAAADGALISMDIPPEAVEKIGSDIAQGLVRGLESVDTDTPVVTMAQGIINKTKAEFQIKSPSKVFEGIGEFVMEGFFNGVEAKEPSVLEQMGGIYSKIIGKFDGGNVDMASKGRSIMDGLWSGLRETWNSISTWLSGIANSISGFFSGIGSKASSKSSPKGSKKFGMYQYANGLDYVPRTMQVTVHEGERILTKAENQQYGTNSGVSVYINANVSNDYDVERLGAKLGESIRNQIRGTGGDLAWN